MLKEAGVEILVDVRSAPGSKKYPQFGKEAMQAALNEEQIGYASMKNTLGGHRYCKVADRREAVSGAWKNRSFGDYAEWMQGKGFLFGVSTLIDVAEHVPAAFMCSEAVPWRCHRSMIADHLLLVAHMEVVDLLAPGKNQPAKARDFARVSDRGTVIYPKEEA